MGKCDNNTIYLLFVYIIILSRVRFLATSVESSTNQHVSKQVPTYRVTKKCITTQRTNLTHKYFMTQTVVNLPFRTVEFTVNELIYCTTVRTRIHKSVIVFVIASRRGGFTWFYTSDWLRKTIAWRRRWGNKHAF